MPVFILILLSNAVMAQKVLLGLKAAPLMGWYKCTGSAVKTGGSSVGFSYGLMADFKIGERYYLGTGFDIAYMGGKVVLPTAVYTPPSSISVPVTNVQINYSNQYIQVPLSLKFRTKEIGHIAYWAQFGYANSFLLHGKASLQSDNGIIDTKKILTNSADVKLNYNYEVPMYRGSMIIGLGIEYPIGGNSRIYSGIKFDNGLFSSVKDKKMDALHSNLSLNFGVYF
ncbi:MAG: PorT family protein [Bacteroidia bacterium]|nr:PorT family protein [Bacteroidia bacterium]